MNEISPVKRRKQRGRSNKEADKTDDMLAESTILHIINDGDEVEVCKNIVNMLAACKIKLCV